MINPIVLAFSGGAASVAAVPWLQDHHGVDVVTVAIGVGQRRELEGIRQRALGAGALRCHVLDREAAFATEVVWPAVRAGVEPGLSSLTLATPLIARSLVEIADMEQAIGVAHAATGSAAAGIECAVAALNPDLLVFASAAGHHDASSGMVAEESLWARSIAGGTIDNPWEDVPETAFSLTRAPRACPDDPAAIELSFRRGLPVAVNGVAMPVPELLDSVATIAGVHGVGRADLIVRRADGTLYRELREAPALTVLRQAHDALEQFTTTTDSASFRSSVGARYTAVLRSGAWFSPFRQALDAYLDSIQSHVSGTVRMTLHKGECRVRGRRLEGYDQPAGADLAQAVRLVRSLIAQFRSIWLNTSGRVASTRPPIPPRSTSESRSRSIAVCSKTTSPAAWRGPMPCPQPVCSTPPTPPRSARG